LKENYSNQLVNNNGMRAAGRVRKWRIPKNAQASMFAFGTDTGRFCGDRQCRTDLAKSRSLAKLRTKEAFTFLRIVEMFVIFFARCGYYPPGLSVA
jgi:hypothetical protein